MANRYAVASGNWSNTATWDGGTLPTAADDVFSNNFTVNVDQNITVLSLRNTASAPIVAGGSFNFNTAGVTASITGATPLAFAVANLLTFSHTTGLVNFNMVNNNTVTAQSATTTILYSGSGNLTITCPNINITLPSTNTIYLSKSGTGTLTLNSNLIATQTGNTGGAFLLNSTNGNVIVNGNLSFSNLGSGSTGAAVINQTVGELTITGNLTPSPSFLAIAYVTVNFSGVTLNITGNLLQGAGRNVVSTGNTSIVGNIFGNTGNTAAYGLNISGTTTITGNVFGNTAPAVFSSSANTITIIGDITASSANNAVVMTSTTGILRLTGSLYNVNNRQAFFGYNIFVNASTPMQARFFTPGIIDRTLYSEDTFPNQPAATNVRESITYGPGSGLVGTLAMPAAADVRSGVVYDSATTGTALFTTALLLSEINTSADPVAIRLKNSATPEILGTILAAYKP